MWACGASESHRPPRNQCSHNHSKNTVMWANFIFSIDLVAVENGRSVGRGRAANKAQTDLIIVQ
mgnify:CR=1 FL=1